MLLPGGAVNVGIPGDGGIPIVILVYVFGPLWLTFFAVPKKVNAILGFVWGIPALVLSLLVIENITPLAADGVYVGYGVYVRSWGPSS